MTQLNKLTGCQCKFRHDFLTNIFSSCTNLNLSKTVKMCTSTNAKLGSHTLLTFQQEATFLC